MKSFEEPIGDYTPDSQFIYERTNEVHTHYDLDRAELFVNSRGRELLAQRAMFWQPLLQDLIDIASRGDSPDELEDFSLYHTGAKSQIYVHNHEQSALWHSSDSEYLLPKYLGGIGSQHPTGVAYASTKGISRPATIALEITDTHELRDIAHVANYSAAQTKSNQRYARRIAASSTRIANKAMLRDHARLYAAE